MFFRGIANLLGGAGADTFVFLPGTEITGRILSGGGPDVFRLSAGGVVGVIDGHAGNDSILGPDNGANGQIAAATDEVFAIFGLPDERNRR